MEATKNCTKAIRATQESGLKANSIIDAIYEGCVSRLVVVQYLVMPHLRHVYVLQTLVRPHVRHVYVLLPLVRPHARHTRFSLHIVVSFKGRTTRSWSFGCGFAFDTAMGCTGFRLLFSTAIVL